MTVRELIEKLQEMPPDAVVCRDGEWSVEELESIGGLHEELYYLPKGSATFIEGTVVII